MATYPATPITKTGSEPTLQKELTIALVMISNMGGMIEYYFDLRPEELTYTHPTRATVVQTLGGAWVDDFGEGIVDIAMSGHTGWRANSVPLPIKAMPGDGMAKAFSLRKLCFEDFHQLRMAAAQDGIDPDEAVQMYFVDTLNKAFFKVYPVSLQIRKHKSRPLLYQYQLRMTGLAKMTNGADLTQGMPA